MEALVPNDRGAKITTAVGAYKILIPILGSETHLMKSVSRTNDQIAEKVSGLRSLINDLTEDKRPYFEAGIATTFGYTIGGHVP